MRVSSMSRKFIQQANRLADLLNAMTLARFRKD